MKLKRIALVAVCAALCNVALAVEFQMGVGAFGGKAAFRDLRIADASGKVLYSGDFSDASSIKGWKQHGEGKWVCANGELAQTAEPTQTAAMCLVMPRAFRNVTLTMKAKRVDGPEGFIVATGTPRLTGGGEWVIFGGWGNTYHGIEQPPFRHTRVGGSIEAGRWYDVKVECTDKRIRAWLDGKLVMESQVNVGAALSTGAASVAPVKDAKALRYSPMIFGHFLEHFDTQIYGGIFWPKHALSDEDGFRKDVIEALREIKTPIVRWPGGCFVSDYHWKYGVGPNRQPMWNKAWAVEDPNTFGTDEFVKWCRKVGCEPYICTNAGTGTPEEMSDWVEYCNLSVGKWGRWRVANGYEKPHDVMYWSVGNENWGGHEIGAKTVAEWGPFVRESSKMMRGTDRRIKLLAAALPDEGWTLPLLKTAGYLLDYVSVHGYYCRGSYLDCIMQTQRPDGDIKRTINVLEKAGFGGGKVGIAFDEWNLRGWHHPGLGNYRRGAVMDYKARRKNDIASTYTMADAVFSACFLNTCLRHCDIVKMANFSPVVNTRGAIFVHDKGIVKRTSYHVFWMYTHLLEANIAPVEVSCGELSAGNAGVPVLDSVLTVSDDGKRRVLAAVNKHPEQTISLDVSALGVNSNYLKVTVLSGTSPNDYNDIGAENRVVPIKTVFAVNDGKVALPPHSLSCIVIAE